MNSCTTNAIGFLVIFLGIIIYTSYNNSQGRQLSKVANKAAQQLIEQRTISVAVLDFNTIDGVLPGLKYSLTNMFKAKLSSYSKSFKIADRSEINRLIEDHKLSEKGRVLEETLTDLGGMYGINAVVRGKFIAEDNWFNRDNAKVFIEVIDLKTGSVVTFETKKFVIE